MRALGVLIMGLLLVLAFTGLQDVRADEADEACKTGLKYYKGEGVTLDYAEALKWFQKAADQGSARAQNNIGVMYYSGEGVTQDYSEALKWYLKAADQGYAKAQCAIGFMCYNGYGVTKDYTEALKWFRLAAEQGNADAQINIGGMYAEGKGVKQDYAEAMKWYQKAADQGDAAAQFNIGAMYHGGQGVSKDYAEALKWFRLAADQGYQDAKDALQKLQETKSVITECVKYNFYIQITTTRPIENVTLSINCRGFFSPSCYNWNGGLKEGKNQIFTTLFVGDDGKRFNPIEYSVMSLKIHISGRPGTEDKI